MDGTAALVGVLDYETQSELVTASALADVDSLLAAPLTLGHPPSLLDLDTTKRYQVGTVLAASVDGDKLRVRIRVTDTAAATAIQAGTIELSPGYRAVIDPTPGKWAGKKYDVVQTGRRYNHLALVDRARGGRQARLDSWRADGALVQRVGKMETVIIDGKEYQLPPEIAAIVSAWQASQEPTQDAENATPSAGPDAGGSAPAPAPALAAKTPSSITVKMDAAEIAREAAKMVIEGLRADRAAERRDAAELGDTIATVRPLLPQSYRVDGKSASTLVADALVAKRPDMANWVRQYRTDGSRLRGALDLILASDAAAASTSSTTSSTTSGTKSQDVRNDGAKAPTAPDSDPVTTARMAQNMKLLSGGKA